jgi:hypothetical protein
MISVAGFDCFDLVHMLNNKKNLLLLKGLKCMAAK